MSPSPVRQSIALCVGLLVAASPAWAGDVIGRVVDRATGKGVPGAWIQPSQKKVVVMSSESESGAVWSATTDRYGSFRLERIPSGSHEFVVEVGDARLSTFLVDGDRELTTLEIEVDASATRYQEEVVVTASRETESLQQVPEAVTVIDRADIEASAAGDLAGVLRNVPGLDFYDAGGSPADPAIDVRGFTGGGENDYLLVMVDGVRINDLGNGRVDWREIPLDRIERVEFVHGPASSLYGDVGIGGVIQIFTQKPAVDGFSGRLHGGGDSQWGGGFSYDVGSESRWLTATLDADTGTGWRDRSEWNDLQGSVRFGNRARGEGEWRVDLWGKFDDHESPGALPEPLFLSDPTQSIYPFDEVRRQRLGASFQWSKASTKWSYSTQASLRYQDDESFETLIIEPKAREFDGHLLWLEGRARRQLSESLALQLGAEIYRGDYSSTYFDVGRSGESLAASADGDGERLGTAAYAQLDWRATNTLKLNIGARFEKIDDDFEESIQDGASADTDNDSVAPRLGVNWSPTDSTAIYFSAAETFKVPTPFQLFDQRRPFGFPITNPELVPQEGVSLSLGFRHAFNRVAQTQLTLYRIDLEDEIGFDPINFRTDNIGESEHQGVEWELDVALANGFTADLGYMLNEAVFETGDFIGNQINNVPEQTAMLGLGWRGERFSVNASTRRVSDLFIDDAETVPIDDYQTFDFVFGYRFGELDLRLQIENAFDEEFASWGFVSPLGGTAFFYPGQQREARLTLRYRSP